MPSPPPLTDPPTQPTTAASTVATTVSTTTATTTDPGTLDLTHPDAPAPEVNLEAETWAELLLVWQDIANYWTWMYAHPSGDPDLLLRILDESGPQYVLQSDGMAQSVENGWVTVSGGAFGIPIGIGCCPDPDAEMQGGAIEFVVTSRSADPPTIVYGPEGEVVTEFDAFDRLQ